MSPADGALARSSAVYLASSLASRAVPFALLPILTRHLSPEELGTVAMFTVAVTLFLPATGLGTDGALTRQLFEADRKDVGRYVTNCLYILTGSAAVIAVVIAVASGPLSRLFEIPPMWLWGVLAVAVSRYVLNALLGLWQARQRPILYAVTSFLQTVSLFAIATWLVVGLDFGWTGRAIAEVVSYGLVGVLGLAVLARQGLLRGGVDSGHMREAVAYGGGVVGHLYGSALFGTVDRLLITNMVGLAQTGLYAVAAQLAMVITVLVQSFNLAWVPWLYARLRRNQPADREQIARVRRIYSAATLVIALGIAFGTPPIIGLLVGPQFEGVTEFLAYLCLAAAFNGLYQIAVTPLFYVGHTHILATISLATGLFGVVCSYVLINLNGALGAAQAAAVSSLIAYVVTAVYARRITAAIARGEPIGLWTPAVEPQP
jgi:O-antigen/teichoic acid export membrane protein